MDYSYPKAILVIVDSLENYSAACHLFANQFSNANFISAQARAQATYIQTVKPIVKSDNPVKPASIKNLLRTHQYVMNVTEDPEYYVKDIEISMMEGEKRMKNKPDFFHVIVALEPLLSQTQFHRLKARKIYFYENRNENIKPPLKSFFCANSNDDFKVLGFSGSMANLANSIQTTYTQYGFKV